MQNTLISIIVPVYNCELFIKYCIESVINQSYHNYELLLCDDGSTDNSLEICKGYAENNEQITVIHHENIGVSKTREDGVKKSKGDFITFLDSDDYIKEDYLKILYDEINKENVNVVCCNSQFNSTNNYLIKTDSIVKNSSIILRDFLSSKRYTHCIWGKLFRRSVLINIDFPDTDYSEDTYIVMKIFKSCDSIKLLRYDGYYYRDNPNSIMNQEFKTYQPYGTLITLLMVYSLYTKELEQNSNKVNFEKLLINWFYFYLYLITINKENDVNYYSLIQRVYSTFKFDLSYKTPKVLVINLYKKHKNTAQVILKIIYKIKILLSRNKELL